MAAPDGPVRTARPSDRFPPVVAGDGWPCCAYCRERLPATKTGKAPATLRYCSDRCKTEVLVRCGIGWAVREELQRRDRQVCAGCWLDCRELAADLEALPGRSVRQRPERWEAEGDTWRAVADIVRPLVDLRFGAGAGRVAWIGYLRTVRLRVDAYLERHGFDTKRSLWDAAHVLAVVEGGGLCGLDGYETLCQACHREDSARLARRLAETRRLPEGEQLQLPIDA